jgi:Na+/H+-dicarboxylate symporter
VIHRLTGATSRARACGRCVGAAADVTVVVGSVAAVTGMIVGAFFGVQVGSSGKEAAEAGRAKAESTARKALAKMDPHEAADLMGSL